jgi:hypothetical protein
MVRIRRLGQYMGTRDKPYELLLVTCAVLRPATEELIKSIVDYIAGEKAIPTEAAGQLICSAEINSLSASISDARHMALRCARSLACSRIFLLRSRRAITSANNFLS